MKRQATYITIKITKDSYQKYKEQPQSNLKKDNGGNKDINRQFTGEETKMSKIYLKDI